MAQDESYLYQRIYTDQQQVITNLNNVVTNLNKVLENLTEKKEETVPESPVENNPSKDTDQVFYLGGVTPPDYKDEEYDAG